MLRRIVALFAVVVFAPSAIAQVTLAEAPAAGKLPGPEQLKLDSNYLRGQIAQARSMASIHFD